MTLCDNGLLTYHPSLHVSLGGRPWGRPGLGDRGSVGRPGSGTLVSSNGRSFELRKDLAWVAWELSSLKAAARAQRIRCGSELWAEPV